MLAADLILLLAGSPEYSAHVYLCPPSSMSLPPLIRLRQRTAPHVTSRDLLSDFLLVANSFETEGFSTFSHLAFWCRVPEMNPFTVRHPCYICCEPLKL